MFTVLVTERRCFCRCGCAECYNTVFWDVTPCNLVDLSPFQRNLLSPSG